MLYFLNVFVPFEVLFMKRTGARGVKHNSVHLPGWRCIIIFHNYFFGELKQIIAVRFAVTLARCIVSWLLFFLLHSLKCQITNPNISCGRENLWGSFGSRVSCILQPQSLFLLCQLVRMVWAKLAALQTKLKCNFGLLPYVAWAARLFYFILWNMLKVLNLHWANECGSHRIFSLPPWVFLTF